MSANNNLHRTSEEGKAQEENEDEEETYDDDSSSEEDGHVDDDSEDIPELIPPRDDTISDSDDTENETDEDANDEIRVYALPSVIPLQLRWGDVYEEEDENEEETRSVSTSNETIEMIRNIDGWIGRPLMGRQYFRNQNVD
ncbi:predicted protein [Chaetoceros tenuissimus]|uniref:Uncharacterized protein n=1 Tax=Chaetoceros tenuissimus TaxID=426638 RepID=A0AAD3H0N0_9STRA|nr:predicted protein [Chaetoceros tenuissimus]